MRPRARSRSNALSIATCLIVLASLLAGLSAGAPPALAQPGTATFDTVQEFSATCSGGPTLSNTTITEDGDGEINLRAGLEDYFRTSPLSATLWFSDTFASSLPANPLIQVANGALSITTTQGATTIGRGYVRSVNPVSYGVIEGVVTFSNGNGQVFGITETAPGFGSNYATISTQTDGVLHALSSVSNSVLDTVIVNSIPTGPRRLRIERTSAGVGQDRLNYYVYRMDGTLEGSQTRVVGALPANLYARLSNNTQVAGFALSADWIRYTPYAAVTGSYTSCPIFTPNERMTWGPISWSQTVPTGTSLEVEIETSNDGNTWSSPLTVSNGAALNQVAGYIRYRAHLGTTQNAPGSSASPALNSLSIGYTPYDLPDQIAPTFGPNETQFLAQGDGFTPNTPLTVSIDGQSQAAPLLNANSYGEFYLYLDSTVAPIGAHSVTISGAGRSPLTLNFTVTDIGVPTTPPPPAGEPMPPTFDMAPPTLTIDDASVGEGDAGTQILSFTVSLSAPSGQVVTVNYATANDSATAPSDYVAVPSTPLTFPAGTTVQTVTVTVNSDIVTEQNEQLFVNLSGATNADIADGQAAGTILNDDGSVISIGNASVTEGNAGTQTLTFTVSLSKPSSQTITVEYATADDTAVAPGDYTAVPTATLSFPIGTTVQTVTVATNGDTLPEADETLLVNLANATNATIFDDQGVGTIANDDAPPTISISGASVIEGNAGNADLVFTVSLSEVSGQDVTVNYATADGSAVAPVDYTAVSPTALLFPAGTTTRTITVTVNGDTLPEPNEALLVNLTAPTNATLLVDQGLGTITNDDAPPTISIADASVTEGNAGVVSLIFTVSLSKVSGQDVSVNYATVDDTAVAPGDYTAVSPTALLFPAGTTSRTVTVTIKGDIAVEQNERLFVNLSGALNATIADGQAAGTILNDDTEDTRYLVYLPIIKR
jgi:hypothetical protein